MLSVIKIVIAILVFLFGFYMFLDDSRRGIPSKLSKEEKRYFDIIEWWFYISNMIIYSYILYPLFN